MTGVLLQLNGENATVHFSDGHEQKLCVSRALLERSTVLRQALSGKSEIVELVAPSPRGVLRSWLQWRTNESSWDVQYARDVEQMLLFLEVRCPVMSLRLYGVPEYERRGAGVQCNSISVYHTHSICCCR